MREVSIRVSLRRNALVHLHHIHLAPRNILLRESTQHLPWRAAAAKRHCESAAFLHRRERRRSDDLSALVSDRIGIREESYFHGIFFSPPQSGYTIRRRVKLFDRL